MPVDDWATFVHRTSVHTQYRSVERRRPLRSRWFNSRLISSHQLVDLGLNRRHGALGQVHIDEGGTNTRVAQQRLNSTQRNTGLQEMRGVGVSQRMTGYVFSDMALANGGLEATLH